MSRIKYILLSVGVCLSVSTSAQVYPGDADNNGQVDHLDILYIGYAYGAVGPARLESGSVFSPQSILVPWANSFSNGINYIYADANGSGWIDWADLLTVNFNYGNQLDTVSLVDFPISTAGANPPLSFQSPENPVQVTAGLTIEIPIILGTIDNPALDVNGLAFTVEYNQQLIHSATLSYANSWPNADGGAFYFQKKRTNPVLSRIEAAESRFGADPVDGWGQIALLSIVIEDDLIGLLPADRDSMEVPVRLKDVVLLNGDFEAIPVGADSLILMVHRPVTSEIPDSGPSVTSANVFPNPAGETISIIATHPMIEMQVFDLNGQLLETISCKGQKEITWPTTDWPDGIYLFRILSERGVEEQKVLVMH